MVPFGAADPTINLILTPDNTPDPPAWQPPPDEGAPLNDEDVAEIIAALNQLPADQRAALEQLAREANAAGCSFSIKVNPSQRRHAIYQALLNLAPLIDSELERVRATVAAVAPDAAHPDRPLGAAIGALTIAEADQLRDIAQQIVAVEPALQYGLDGAVRWATHIPTNNHPNHEEEDNV